MRLSVALAFFVLPLAIAPAVSFYYDVVPKAGILLLSAAVALIAAVWNRQTLSEMFSGRTRRLYAALLCGSILVALISATVSTEPALAWNGSNWRRFGAVTQTAIFCVSLLLTGFVARDSKRTVTSLRAVALAGIVAGIYGIVQYFGWDPFLNGDAYRAGEGPFRIVRPPGPLGHSDYYSAWLLWPVFWGLALAQAERSVLWRSVGAISVGVACVAIVLSGSRGSLIGVALGLSVVAIIRRPNLRITAAAAGVVLAAIALFYISPAGAQLRARAHWAADEPLGGARLLLWGDSLIMAKTRPVLGFGPDTFVADFPQFQSVRLAQAYPDFYHESPHNMFLDALTGEGAAGLLLLVGIIVTGFIAGVHAARGPHTTIAVPLLASVAAVVAAHQFTVLTIPSAVCLYTAVGMLVVLGEPRVPESSRQPSRFAIGFAAVPAALLFAAYGACLVTSDHSLALAKRALESGDVQGARDAYSDSRRLGPLAVSADLYLSRRSAAAAAAATGTASKLRYAEFANATAYVATQAPEQRANAWYNMAALAATRGDTLNVETSLRTAIRFAPNWFKPHWALARVLKLTGRNEDGAIEALHAAELDGSRHAEVTVSVGEILRSASIRK